MTIKSLDLVSLDFQGQKDDLIAFLRTNPLFQDYDFEGSNINLLADLLAYNSTKNAFLVNQLLSEAFLSSAQLNSSVYSHAAELSYTPRSARSAKATIQLKFEATGVNQPYILPKGSSFSTLIKNQAYVFSIPETLSISSSNTTFTTTLDIYEGTYVKDSYIFSTTPSNPYPTFTLTNKNIDTESLSVAVYEDSSSTAISYQLKSSLLDLTDLDRVFFLQENENGYYEIIFGDGVIGLPPKQNSLIVLDYRITNADVPNGASSFFINFDPTNPHDELNNAPVVTTITPASGGAIPESLESIRYYAPRHFQTQERCIVPSDYETLMKIQFPEINAISVYGGEKETPPRYGYVMVCVDISGFETLPTTKIADYTKFLSSRCPLTISPLFINPDHTYLQINSLVRYNINVTTNTVAYIKSLIKTAVANFNIDNLNSFNVILRFSKLTNTIDSADPSIISNLTDIAIYKKLQPQTGIASNITINFNTALVNDLGVMGDSHNTDEQKCLTSTGLVYQGEYGYLEDDGAGKVRIVKKQNDNKTVKLVDVGTIDYENGIINLYNIIFDSFEGPHFKVYVLPRDKDVSTLKNTIMSIESDEINLDIQQVRV